MEGNRSKLRAVLVFGAPGSGKTTFAEKFAKKFNLAYYNLDEIREELPVITNLYYKDKEGNKYYISDKSSPYYDKLQEYWRVVYYQMFEK